MLRLSEINESAILESDYVLYGLANAQQPSKGFLDVFDSDVLGILDVQSLPL